MSEIINGIMLKDTNTIKSTQNAQKLRLIRLGMASVTYIVVFLAAFLITRLSYGQMSIPVWLIFIMIGMLGNVIFFLMIKTGVNLRFKDPSLTKEQIIYSTVWGMIPLYFLHEVRPIVLMFYLPAFSFGMLRLNRKLYFSIVALDMTLYGAVLLIEFLKNRSGFIIQYEIFLFVEYGILLSWFAFFGGYISNLRRLLSEHNSELQKAVSKIKTLSGFLPICASCKKIRDDKGYWNQIESYIRDHSEAEFSHSICPECAKRDFPEIYSKDQ